MIFMPQELSWGFFVPILNVVYTVISFNILLYIVERVTYETFIIVKCVIY